MFHRYCKAHPDEKGIETRTRLCSGHIRRAIARPIPTKRELKLELGGKYAEAVKDCKAHPDEKGIETFAASRSISACLADCKAHPDEKGIETTPQRRSSVEGLPHCKAHPDEKGIETLSRSRG